MKPNLTVFLVEDDTDLQLGCVQALQLAEALNQPAPLDLRVNTLKMNRETLLEKLAADGIAAAPGPLSPMAVRMRDKPALAGHHDHGSWRREPGRPSHAQRCL